MKLSDFTREFKDGNLNRLAFRYSAVGHESPARGEDRKFLCTALLDLIREISAIARRAGIDLSLQEVDEYYGKYYAEICSHAEEFNWNTILVESMIDRYLGRRYSKDRILKMVAHMKRYMVAAQDLDEQIKWEDLK